MIRSSNSSINRSNMMRSSAHDSHQEENYVEKPSSKRHKGGLGDKGEGNGRHSGSGGRHGAEGDTARAAATYQLAIGAREPVSTGWPSSSAVLTQPGGPTVTLRKLQAATSMKFLATP